MATFVFVADSAFELVSAVAPTICGSCGEVVEGTWLSVEAIPPNPQDDGNGY